MDASVGQFNRLVGSFESNVLPGARKFTELGVAGAKETPQPTKIDTAAREPNPVE
jgi:DNA recombination protein RmuC